MYVSVSDFYFILPMTDITFSKVLNVIRLFVINWLIFQTARAHGVERDTY